MLYRVQEEFVEKQVLFFKQKRLVINVKFSLCFKWAPPHDGVLRSGGIAPLIIWPRHQIEVTGRLHAPAALPPGKEPPVPIE
jgi:hypothetical protein